MKSLLVASLLVASLLISSAGLATCLSSEREVLSVVADRVDHVDETNALRIAEENAACFPESKAIKAKIVDLHLAKARTQHTTRKKNETLNKAMVVAQEMNDESLIAKISSEMIKSEDVSGFVNPSNSFNSINSLSLRRASVFGPSRNRTLNGWRIYSSYGGYAIWIKAYRPGRGINGVLYWFRFADERYDYVLNSACPPNAQYWKPVPTPGVYHRGNYNRGYEYICSNPFRWGYYHYRYGYPAIWLL